MAKRDKPIPINLRESFEAQLPIVAAILASTAETYDPADIAEEAIDLCMAIEEALTP